jgi:putative transposase
VPVVPKIGHAKVGLVVHAVGQGMPVLVAGGSRCADAGYFTEGFTEGFDAVFTAVGAHVVPMLPGVPRMNAIADRWVGSCRREATDQVLITGERHLRLVVDEYAGHHNEHRPHRSLGQRCPDGVDAPEPPAADGPSRVIRRDPLGALIHEYAQIA